MARAPFQVLVLPYHVSPSGSIEYAVFRRRDDGVWQGIAGGGEGDETPLAAAQRESFEEAGIASASLFIKLDSVATVPVERVAGFAWGDDVLVIPEYAFGVEVSGRNIRLSREHTEFRWVDCGAALGLLKWDSNRAALWELDLRLRRAGERTEGR